MKGRDLAGAEGDPDRVFPVIARTEELVHDVGELVHLLVTCSAGHGENI